MGCKKNSPCTCCGMKKCSCTASGDPSLVPMTKGSATMRYPKTQDDNNKVGRRPKNTYPRAGVEVQF